MECVGRISAAYWAKFEKAVTILESLYEATKEIDGVKYIPGLLVTLLTKNHEAQIESWLKLSVGAAMHPPVLHAKRWHLSDHSQARCMPKTPRSCTKTSSRSSGKRVPTPE